MARQRPPRRHRTTEWYVLAIATALAGMIAVSVVALWESPTAAPTNDGGRSRASDATIDHARPARRETRPTLDPARFTGAATRAYQVAREIPDVLDQLQCYCACGSQYGHVSLLSCYTDGHGST
jgi:hypothetical protein